MLSPSKSTVRELFQKLAQLSTLGSRNAQNASRCLLSTDVQREAVEPKSPIEKLRSRLLYQSLKRGILENDIIIGEFARTNLPLLNEDELHAYDKMINGEHNEWDLFYYVSSKKPPPPELENDSVFLKIKAYVDAKKDGEH